MLRILDGLTLVLSAHMNPADNVMTVSPNSVGIPMLNSMPIGDEVYIRLQDARAYEVVRYTHSAPITIGANVVIAVDRAVMGTSRKLWGLGTCGTQSFDDGVLRAFICHVKGQC